MIGTGAYLRERCLFGWRAMPHGSYKSIEKLFDIFRMRFPVFCNGRHWVRGSLGNQTMLQTCGYRQLHCISTSCMNFPVSAAVQWDCQVLDTSIHTAKRSAQSFLMHQLPELGLLTAEFHGLTSRLQQIYIMLVSST